MGGGKIQVYSRRTAVKWVTIYQYLMLLINLMSSIILIPLYLKHISVNTYGIWLATGNVLVWITAIDPGLSAVVQQKIAKAYGQKDKKLIGNIIFGSLVISGIISLTIFLAGSGLAKFLPQLLRIHNSPDIEAIEKAFLLAVIGSCLMVYSFSIISINKGLLSSIGVGNIGVSSSLLAIGITVALLMKGDGLMALPIGLIVRGGGFLLGNIIYLGWRMRREHLQISYSREIVKKLIALISYTFFGKLGNILANNMDLLVISRYLGPEAVTTLALTKKAPEISKTVVERPPVAFMPAISHLWGEGRILKAKEQLVRLIRILTWISALVFGGFFVFNDNFISLWVGSELFAGMFINLFICLWLILSMVSNSIGTICFALGNIRGNSIVTFFHAILTAALILVGVKYFGILGVVIAPVISNLLLTSWYYPSVLSKLLTLYTYIPHIKFMSGYSSL